ncbi:MAG: hypothetical protein WA130_07030 [Candidatus Methanoperedens sp.]
MKKHKKIKSIKLMNQACDDFNEIEDLRFLSIIGHQYVDYFLNEIICNIFENPELIIDNNELGQFFNKFTLLKSLGYFKGRDDLEKNIKLMTSIRNFYAHNMLIGEEVPENIINKINEMKYLEDADNYEVEFSSVTDIKGRFIISWFSTIVILNSLSRK